MSEIDNLTTFYHLVCFSSAAFVWLISGIFAASIYSRKGRSGIVGFLAGLLLGPIGVLIAALTSPDRAHLRRQAVEAGLLRECPHCYELIDSRATVCPQCHRDVPKHTKPLPDPIPDSPASRLKGQTPTGDAVEKTSNAPIILGLSVIGLLLCLILGIVGLSWYADYQEQTEDMFVRAMVAGYCGGQSSRHNLTVEDIDCSAWAEAFVSEHPAIVEHCGSIYNDLTDFMQCMDDQGAAQYFP
jgi:hypothetical protein